MRVGVVTGAVWATRKCAALQGQTLLVTKLGSEALVAADLVGAGTGDRVLVARGSCIRALTDAPVDAAIVAILDQTEAGYVDQ
jgi:ethanolamine utilization protein EutN